MHYPPHVYIYSIVRLYKNPAGRWRILHILRKDGNENRPTGAGREGDRPSGGGWFFLALTGGVDFSHDDGWFIAPPIFSFSERRKRENGPCTVQKRKRLFGPCGSALYSSELLREFDG